jgi:cytidyltransferase-like protein
MIIGFADIVGDLFHYNHINFFKNCKEYCDYLIIGICSDDFCKDYKRIPVLSEQERLLSVKYCKYVDDCFIINCNKQKFDKEFIELHKIDKVFHAHNINEHDKYKQFYLYPIEANKFIRLDYNDGISTSKLINKIKNNY